MDTPYYPAARWSTLITCITMLIVALLLFLVSTGLYTGPRDRWSWQMAMVWLPLAFLIISPLFIIRGYTLEGDFLRVRRPGWSTTVDLRTLQEAFHDPAAMKRSWRLFGNGGLFCVAGLFRNKTLGNYRAFVTNPSHAVVLRFAQRVVVLSPEDPEALIAALPARTDTSGTIRT